MSENLYCDPEHRRISESTRPSIQWNWYVAKGCLTIAALWLCAPQDIARAQPAIVPDETLGSENSVVVPNVEIRGIDSSRIDGGARRGGNLFHSFQEFNIELNRGAYFSNPEGIDNILTRVTGSNLSNINGTLGVLGNANLFLINPNGLIFGPGASLDINGSFVGSTAESVLFEEYGFSAADPSAPPMLTLNVPVGLQFGANPGDIVVRSQLRELTSGEFAEAADAGDMAETAQTVNAAGELLPGSILGELAAEGDVDLFRLSLPEGTIFSASTVGGTAIDTTLTVFDTEGTRIIENDNSQGTLQSTLPPQVIGAAGEVLLGISSVAPDAGDPSSTGAGADLPASGEASPGSGSSPFTIFFNVTDPNNAGGLQVPPGETLALVGGNVTLEGGGLAAPGGQVELGGLGANGTALLTQAGDNVRLSFPEEVPLADVALRDGAVVDVRADDGGSITIQAQNLEIAGQSALLAGIVENSGVVGARGGDVTLNAAGDITIRASSVLNQLNVGAIGNSGNIDIAAGSFALEDARVNANVIEATGDAGRISIEADEVAIRGNSTRLESRVSNNPDPGDVGAEGNAGSILIAAGSFILEDRARINTNLSGIGNAGDIAIEADEVAIRGNGILASRVDFDDTDIGDAGSILIAAGSFILEDGARANTNLGGIGNAGRISIEADEVAIRGNGTRLTSGIDRGAQGNAGSIGIVTRAFTLEDGARVNTNLSGIGDAGRISIEADEVAIRGSNLGNGMDARLESTVTANGEGNAGSIRFDTGSLTLADRAEIRSNNAGRGNSGNIEIQADGAVLLSNASIANLIAPGAISEEGVRGTIAIDADSIQLVDGAQLVAAVRPNARGNGGNLVLRARNEVLISGVDETTGRVRHSTITSVIGPGAVGDAGSISIEAGSFTLADGARVNSNIVTNTIGNSDDIAGGTGNAGRISIAADEVAIRGDETFVSSRIDELSEGNAGDVFIETGSFTLADGAEITSSLLGRGNRGKIEIRAGEESLVSDAVITSVVGDGAIFEEQRSVVGGAEENANSIEIATPILTLANNARITTTTSGSGDAGSIAIDATDTVNLGQGTSLLAETSSAGRPGEIQVITPNLFIGEGAQLSTRVNEGSTNLDGGGSIAINTSNLSVSGGLGIFAETDSTAPAGDLTIQPYAETPNLAIDFTADGFISTQTSDSGSGGEINISAPQTLNIAGQGSITASTTIGSTGASGSIVLNAETIDISDASVAVNSQGSAPGGNITINANDLNLERGSIAAETAGTDGGNININLENLLVLRDESAITTTAGTDLAGGNGGIITIDSSFVVAFPSAGPAGNDIFANAFNGEGGTIAISTEGLFGIAFSDLATPRESASNDITVSSTFGLSGSFDLVSPEVNPTDALTTFPTQTIEARVFEGCQAAGGKGGSVAFYNLGHGGLPLSERPAREYGGALGTWTALAGTTAHTVPTDSNATSEIAAAFRTSLQNPGDERLSSQSSIGLIPTCRLF